LGIRVIDGKKTEGKKRPLGRRRRRWVDNIKIDPGWIGMDWIGLSLNRDQWWALVNAVMDLPVV
jgi:hypothetical protein